jgi:L-ascorbate metabolism protein UlaG (beta-lactamase superfamily)
MRIRWYGQSAFLIADEKEVFLDPFGVPGETLAARGLE